MSNEEYYRMMTAKAPRPELEKLVHPLDRPRRTKARTRRRNRRR